MDKSRDLVVGMGEVEMNKTIFDVISNEEAVRVHGYANFGDMTPREVINDGVLKYSMGYTGGSTQIAILREHGLITKPKGYHASLTVKGKSYMRALFSGRLSSILEDLEFWSNQND